MSVSPQFPETVAALAGLVRGTEYEAARKAALDAIEPALAEMSTENGIAGLAMLLADLVAHAAQPGCAWVMFSSVTEIMIHRLGKTLGESK